MVNARVAVRLALELQAPSPTPEACAPALGVPIVGRGAGANWDCLSRNGVNRLGTYVYLGPDCPNTSGSYTCVNRNSLSVKLSGQIDCVHMSVYYPPDVLEPESLEL